MEDETVELAFFLYQNNMLLKCILFLLIFFFLYLIFKLIFRFFDRLIP